MSLNTSKGNMYEWVTHTWNTIKGKCYHDCSYCYMKRWGGLNPVRFDEKELRADLGSNNIIFVGSSCDMFAKDIPQNWIIQTLKHCRKFETNSYLFQTKDPRRMFVFNELLSDFDRVCTTIETNRRYPDIMNNCPSPYNRAYGLSLFEFNRYITIEPIMDFDLPKMVDLMKFANPVQVNIGADSGNNNLPEPSKEKILQLINKLEKFTVIKQKKNLKRLLK